MGRVVAYRVPSAYSPEGLVEKVQKMVEDGWVPLGGVAVVRREKKKEPGGVPRYLFLQAMVKYERDAEDEAES